jgi:hypothetical protein
MTTPGDLVEQQSTSARLRISLLNSRIKAEPDGYKGPNTLYLVEDSILQTERKDNIFIEKKCEPVVLNIMSLTD